MSTAIGALARANPVPAAMRDELDAYALTLRDAWRAAEPVDVRVRGGRRRIVVALAVGVVVLLAASAALALRGDWIDFSKAEHAPPRVVKLFADENVEAPPGMGPGVISAETRRIPVRDNTGRVHTFWVAPTRRGGWCLDVVGVGGGCNRISADPLALIWGYVGRRPGPTAPANEIFGYVAARWVDSVVVRFADGGSVRPRVVWVSPPINGGFLYYRVPRGREATSVEGLDASGELVVAEYGDSDGAPVPPPYALLGERTELARAATPDGEAVLWTAPTRYGGTCRWIEIGGTPHPVPSPIGCVPRSYAHAVARWVPTAHSVVVAGRFDSRFRTAMLTFADYAHAAVPLHDGVLMYVVPSDHLTPGTELAEIRAVPRRGSPTNIEIVPGLSGCEAPLPTATPCR
jgi:hypothetical protein